MNYWLFLIYKLGYGIGIFYYKTKNCIYKGINAFLKDELKK